MGQRGAVFDREVGLDFVFFPGSQVAIVKDDLPDQAVPGFDAVVGTDGPQAVYIAATTHCGGLSSWFIKFGTVEAQAAAHIGAAAVPEVPPHVRSVGGEVAGLNNLNGS